MHIDEPVIKAEGPSGVNNIKIDTTRHNQEVILQVVIVTVSDQTVEFLLDGGSATSVVAHSLIKKLGLENQVSPTNKSLCFGDGVVEVPVGTVKLPLLFSDEVEVMHNFCVVDNPNTRMILGLDFSLQANVITDPIDSLLRFRYQDQAGVSKEFYVPIHPAKIKSQAQHGEISVNRSKGQVVTPVSLVQNSDIKLKQVAVDHDLVLQPGTAELVWLHVKDVEHWHNKSIVIEPDKQLFYQCGVYMMPTWITVMNEEFVCVIMVNLMPKVKTLKTGTLIGKLLDIFQVSNDAKIVQDVNEVLYYLTTVYINFHEEGMVDIAPSVKEGPVFKPSAKEVEKYGILSYVITTDALYCRVYLVMSLEYNINLELSQDQRERLSGVLNKHKKVFATSLRDVKALKAEEYEIKLKEGAKPVKVTPRVTPHNANEWFKQYLAELLDLGLIEPCTGPWAAGVVLEY